jgi:SAM-dependent methyltransferase
LKKDFWLAKTYRKIQQWDHWLSHLPGQSVLDAELCVLTNLLKKLSGKHAVLIGTPKQLPLLKSSVIANQFLISPIRSSEAGGVETELSDLPIASGSVDLVILPHLLEQLDNPRQLLAEACRVVKPEGHIVICGFNPYSLWGLKQMLMKHKNMPWSGRFIQSGLVKKWLGFADFELVNHTMTLFRPPIKRKGLFKCLGCMEWLGRTCFVPFGGVYILVAQAKVIPLTPIKLKWQQKISGLSIPSINIARPSIRNQTK